MELGLNIKSLETFLFLHFHFPTINDTTLAIVPYPESLRFRPPFTFYSFRIHFSIIVLYTPSPKILYIYFWT